MERTKVYQLIELLEEFRDEEIKDFAKECKMEEEEVRAKLNEYPDEIYDMDYGDCCLQAIDSLLAILES